MIEGCYLETVIGRVAAGISVTRYVPPPSQNRTWSVTPSGSQIEAFTGLMQ
jgi:hypothetical protein